jgi:hypothetical protein
VIGPHSTDVDACVIRRDDVACSRIRASNLVVLAPIFDPYTRAIARSHAIDGHADMVAQYFALAPTSSHLNTDTIVSDLVVSNGIAVCSLYPHAILRVVLDNVYSTMITTDLIPGS